MTKNKQIALHLSERAFSLVEIDNKGSIVSSARVLPTVGLIEIDKPINNSAIIKAIDKTFSSAKPKKVLKNDVQIVLPSENYLFTTLVVDKDKESWRVIKKELPGSIDDWVYSEQSFYHPEKEVKTIVISAVKRNAVEHWQNILRQIDLNFEDYSPDYVGLVQCVNQNGLQAIVDLGDEHSKLIITLDGKLIWGESLPFGEKSWWQSVDVFAKLKEVEIVKQYDDLIKQKPRKGSLSEKAINKLSLLVELITAGLADFNRFYDKDVDCVTLFGRMSGVKGIDDVLSKQLNLPVKIGFCPVKKIKNQNYANSWGAAKLTLNSSIYNISMARTSSEKHTSSEESVEEPKTTKIKTRSIDAAVHNGHVKPKKSSFLSVSAVLLVLFVLAAASIWLYGNWQSGQPIDVEKTDDQNIVAPAPTKTINSDISFSFTADTVDMTGQRLARTVRVQTNTKATSTDEGLALASADLAEDEALWPVMFGNDTWLIYRQPLLLNAAQEYLRSLQSTSTDSIVVNSLVPKRISAGKKEGEFVVVATVEAKMANDITLNLSGFKDLLATTTATTKMTNDTAGADEIIIANTPAGWANVRSGAGLQNQIVGKVNDGEKYKVIEQVSEWYKIKLANGDIAWVIKKYTR